MMTDKRASNEANPPADVRRQENAGDCDEKIDHLHSETLKTDVDGHDDELAMPHRRKKTNPVEISLVRKLDWIMLPMLWIMYWFNYLDRNAIAVARLDGLEDELGLSSTEYVTSVSILFVGYILGQIPSSKFPVLDP